MHFLTGAECKKQFDLLTAEKKPEVKPEVKKTEPKIKEEVKETPTPIPPPAAPPPALKRDPSSGSLSNSADNEDHFFNTNGHTVEAPFSFPPPNFAVPPPTADYYGGWHQPTFWNSGNSWLTQPPPENSNHLNEQEDDKKEEEHVPLDLDTRIELLLKGKMSTLNTPAFLQLHLDGSSNSGSSRSSSRAADHVNKTMDPCVSPPLSPPPSPFLSQEIYLEHHKAAHPELAGTILFLPL